MRKLAEILPKNHHLKICSYAMITVGAWPLKFENNPKLKKLYYFYSNTMFAYFITFVLRQFIEMFRLIIIGNLERTMQNVGLTLLTAISLVRVLVCKSNYVLKIINNITEVEKKILACDEQEVKNVYMSYAKHSQFVNKFFIMVGTLTAAPFYLGPLAEQYSYPELYIPDNVTGKINRRLPLSAWTPYDYNAHYVWAFIWQIADGWIAECYVVYTDVFMFSLMIFPVGQLKVLQYILRHFQYFAHKEARVVGIAPKKAGDAVARACVILHKDIISYVENLNGAMKYLMLLDFASCSLQMSVILFQIIMTDFNIPMVIAVEFLMSMIIQMFLFYWHANEIIVASLEVAGAAVDNEWYDESKTAKNMLQVMIQRAQKPLTVSIGPFYPMSTDTAISILKATYSYGMLLRQSYTRKME